MKSETRVPTHYKRGTVDWNAYFDMLLDDGTVCGDCVHAQRCRMIFGGDDKNDSCQFYPSRFSAP